ncbi:hypothetical protein LLG96_17285 [bacterium]|nr:hypothetical protein [bacterium]
MILKMNILKVPGSLPVADFVMTKFSPQQMHVMMRAISDRPTARDSRGFFRVYAFHGGLFPGIIS